MNGINGVSGAGVNGISGMNGVDDETRPVELSKKEIMLYVGGVMALVTALGGLIVWVIIQYFS